MPVVRKVNAEAADTKTGMTLDELAAFVSEAMRADVPGDTVVRQTTTWKQSIKKLEVAG